jgi:UrcA family protein
MNTTTPFTRIRRLIATAIVSAFASSFAVVCAAADDTETVSVVVKFGDLNVSNPQGAATLYGRIVAAAHNVCGSYDSNDVFHHGSRARVNACVHKAIADAVTRVGQPELFAVYNTKNRQPLPITVAAAQAR